MTLKETGRDLLVFIHGLGCSKAAFSEAWHTPCTAGYSLLSFDLLGFGDSPKPTDFPYSMESHAGIVDQVLQPFLSRYRVHLVGSSMGPLIGPCC